MNRTLTKTILTVGAAGLLAASSAAQATWYVDVSNSNPPGTGTLGDPYTSIQYAIDQGGTSSGDVIEIAEGTYEETLNLNGKSLILRGTSGAAATVVDGAQAGSVVTVGSGEVGALFEGLTFANGTGKAGGWPWTRGGGVYCDGGAGVTLRNCAIVSNMAFAGAGLFCANADVLLESVDVLSNVAWNSGKGAGIAAGLNASVTLTSSLIKNNDIPAAGEGGGIHAADGATVLVQHSTVEQNYVGNSMESSPGYGGGVFATCDTFVVIEDSLIANNSRAAIAGGGLYGAATLRRSVVADHTGVQTGGGLNSGGCTLELTDCVVRNNSAFGDAGNGRVGGIWGPATLTRCAVVENTSNAHGGAWGCLLIESSIVGNRCTSSHGNFAHGGGVAASTAIGCLIADNTARVADWTLDGRGGGASGSDLSRCILVGNTAGVGGAAAASTLDRCTVYNNVTTDGAAIEYGSVRRAAALRLPAHPCDARARGPDLQLQANPPPLLRGEAAGPRTQKTSQARSCRTS